MPDQPAQEQRKDTQCSRLLHGCTGLGARRVKNSRWGIDYIRMSALGGIPGVVVGSLVCGIGRNPLRRLGLRGAHCLAHWLGPVRAPRNPRGLLPAWCGCIAPSLSTCPLVCARIRFPGSTKKAPRGATPARLCAAYSAGLSVERLAQLLAPPTRRQALKGFPDLPIAD
jgi:hypothetical protein